MPETTHTFKSKGLDEIEANYAAIAAKKKTVAQLVDEQLAARGLTLLADGGFEVKAGDSSIRVDKDGVTIGGGNPFGPVTTTPPDTTTTPPPDTVNDALSRIEEDIADVLGQLLAATQTLAEIAAIDAATARHGRDFINRLLGLFGFKERVSLPGDAAPVDPAERRLRTIQRTQQRLIKARQTERAAGDIADKLQACAEYAVRNTEPVDAYDLSNEERKTEDEIRCLETQIDRFRDTEARAAARAETAERVLVEMGAWPKAVG